MYFTDSKKTHMLFQVIALDLPCALVGADVKFVQELVGLFRLLKCFSGCRKMDDHDHCSSEFMRAPLVSRL